MDERPSAILAEPAAATGLPGRVLARAGEAPEEPALFYPDGMDVRWRSWGALAAQAAAGAAALAALGLPPGARVAFRWRPDPDAVVADLAVQAAGLVSVPTVAPGAAAPGGGGGTGPAAPEARLLVPDETDPEDGLPAARLAAAAGEGGGRSGGQDATPHGLPGAGGAWVVDGGAAGPGAPPGHGAVLGAAELLARARDLEERLARAVSGAAAVVGGARHAPGTGGREIVAASFDLRYTDGRTFLAWALATGAALFLEPDPYVLPGSVAWVRPTLVGGEARPLGELGRRVRKLEERGPRLLRRRSRRALPYGRLRLLVVLGTGRLAVDDIAFWAGRGVAVARV